MRFAADYEARCFENSDIRDHLPTLYAFGKNGAVVIELGVRGGNSTAAFLAAQEATGGGRGHVYSVDIERPAVPEHWAGWDGWTVIIGDDLEVAGYLPDNADVVFIDTSHTYGHTLAELETYAPKVRPGGVILLHDTELEYAPDHPEPPEYPVYSAVVDWQAIHPDWKAEFHPGCYGLGLLFAPEEVSAA